VPVRRRRRAKVRPVDVAGGAASGAEYQSKAIDRALTVLECFPASDTTLSLSELAVLSGFPESSLFRVLATLERRGYLLRNADVPTADYRVFNEMGTRAGSEVIGVLQ